MVPGPHLPRHQDQNGAFRQCTVHLDYVLLSQRRQKVIGGGENSPPMQPSLHQQVRHGVMSVGHSTISPRPALKQYEQRVNTINKSMVWFQHWLGATDGAVIF